MDDVHLNWDLLRSASNGELPTRREPTSRVARELEELRSLPHTERLRRVRQARSRFRSPSLARLLLAASQEQIEDDPAESFCLAELALVVTDFSPRMSPMSKTFEFTVLAAVAMGNACRAAGSPRVAAKHLAYARTVLRGHAITDPEVLARVDDLAGSLEGEESS